MQIFMHLNFAIFVQIFMKFSPKCRAKQLGMIYTILGSFCSYLNWEGADIRPQFRPRKIPACPFGFSPGSALFAKIKTIIVLDYDPMICTMTHSMWNNSTLYKGLKISVHS